MKKTLLVVVENVSLRRLISSRLKKSGYRIVDTRNWNDALKEIKTLSFDLMLLDINLLSKHGESEINGAVIQVPYILITGDEDEEKLAHMIQSGALDYLRVDQGFSSLWIEKVKKFCRDIDREKELQGFRDALIESEQKVVRILDTLKDPVYICSADYEIQYSNPVLQSLIGKRIRSKKCYAAVFGTSKKCQACPEIDLLNDPSNTKQVEINVDGEPRFYKVSISPINFHNGSISRLHILNDITELIMARDQAARNEHRFKLVADNAIDVVWQMDLRLEFTYLSPSAENILGYHPDKMVGHNLWEFASRKEFVKMARHAMGAIRDYKNFTTLTFQTIMTHKNGHDVHVEITGKLLKDDSGKVIGLQGSTKDITERIEAQSNQAEQHALLRTLIDNIPDTIYVKDISGRYILNNTGHQKELKVRNQDQILHKTDLDFYDPETAEEFFRDEQRIVDSGIPMINKEEYRSFSDGSHSWTLTSKVPIKDKKGMITGIAGINRDITGRKIIEDELFKSRYELALKNKIANIFLTSDTKNLFSEVLKIILAEFKSPIGFFGYINDKDELVCPSKSNETPENGEMSDNNYVFPRESWEGIWGRSLLQRKSLFANQSMHLPVGHSTIQSLLCVPISFKNELLGQICIGNKPGGYHSKDQQILESIVLYIAPILHSFLKEEQIKLAKEEAFYQLKNAKEKAEESDSLKSAFLMNLSHELRTPLNAIIGFSNVLMDRTGSEGNNDFIGDQINSAGDDLMKMIEDTIEMAEIECGQLKIVPKKQELGKTLVEVQAEFHRKYTKLYPEIEFHLIDKTHGLVLDTDHDKLRNALINILSNSVKFSGNGRVELGSYRLNGSQLLIYVSDTGIGIPKELHEAVFEKFRKIESKETLYRGNGLGLSITKGLVQKIGGSITIDSAPGRGTRVEINLPIN